ncbi:MAG: RluA family pseudouridine synthase [Candidatus Omnitrophota bacterium]|nr:RluA family pseudouridine synthase [Candidatus Omnitrophota bacterium]
MDGKRYKIVYEDEQLIVVDKPSGMLVIPTPKRETNTLTDLLNRDLDELRSGPGQANAYPCHRIDRETSGLIVYAKGKSIQRIMMDEFKKRAVKKTYIAFVNGRVAKDFDIINKRIYNRNKNRFDEAVTKYKTIERREGFTIIEAEPVTGRTNQIRIHFKEIGHPLVGESVYAFRKDFKLKFKRVALHASYIRFTHPATKKLLEFLSPMPGDMEAFLRNTRDA